eukprot:TRINITY_DN2725_c0_g2_i1.p1 TRINITY_DN2725_c0_g2~~TRINITY_DN2725_c0_g2_i1.p1  ORF type:complete len:237 (-),score=5.51 TRINITY_DN2725_c0_g2_i1:24-734(-)
MIWESVDITLTVFAELDHRSLVQCTRVCCDWNKLISSLPQFNIPKTNLLLWLDSQDGLTLDPNFSPDHPRLIPQGTGMSSWRSLVGGVRVVPDLDAGRGRDNAPGTHEVGPPLVHWQCGYPAVFFDYGHTGRFVDRRGQRVGISPRTIISVHSFEREGRLDHQTLHGYPGELCNFYILTDADEICMHTNGEDAPNNLACGESALGKGRVRINRAGGRRCRRARGGRMWVLRWLCWS